MPSLTKVWVHYVWATKHRVACLTEDKKDKLLSFIKNYARQKDIQLIEVNGYLDHIHCLVRLKSSQSILEIPKLIKGASAYWMNEQALFEFRFQWQNGYYAESIGKRQLDVIQNYIIKQEAHHQNNNLNFQEIEG